MNKPWWMYNGTLKKAAWIAALVFAAGTNWTKLDAMQRSVDGLEKRVASVEKVLMEK